MPVNRLFETGCAAVCAAGIGLAMNTGKQTYVLPTFGEYRFTGDSENDIWMVLPGFYLETLVDGFKHMHKAGWRYPIPRFSAEHEARWPAGMYGWETWLEYQKLTAEGKSYEDYKDDWFGTYTDKDWFKK